MTKDKDRSLFLLCCVSSDLYLRWFNVLSPQGHIRDFCCFHWFMGGSRNQQSTSREHQAGRRPRTKTEAEVGRKRLFGAWKKFFLSVKISFSVYLLKGLTHFFLSKDSWKQCALPSHGLTKQKACFACERFYYTFKNFSFDTSIESLQ